MSPSSLEAFQTDMKELKKEVHEIKELLLREPELREGILRRLEEARKTPKTEYISHEEMKKEFS